MKKTALTAVCTAVLAGGAASGALAQDVKEDPGKVEQAGSDLTIKNILYVVMPPASAG